jgi:uncharacterized membrane protein YkvA (DUF1232 family)
MLKILKKRAEMIRRDAYALYLASRHPGVPRISKIIMVGMVAYILSPIDLIPDFIPIIGGLDELILLPLGITLLKRSIPGEIWEECRERAVIELASGLPRNQKAVWVVCGLWLLILGIFGWVFVVHYKSR